MFSLDTLPEKDVNPRVQELADILKLSEEQAKQVLALIVDTSLMASKTDKEDTEDAEEEEMDDEQSPETEVSVEESVPTPF